MTKKQTFPLLFSILLLFAFIAAPVSAREYFTTERYDVEMTVTEDHAYHITETIHVNFTEPRHGLYRYIPFRGQFYREINGSRSSLRYNAHMTDIDVADAPFIVEIEDDNRLIQIGDEDLYVDGPQVYQISYVWNPGDDQIPDFDDVYYNILPHNWKTPIEQATLTIHMPKAFDPASLEFLTGSYGKVTNANMDYTVEGTTIRAELTTPLNVSEGVTLNLRLPEGYYTAIPNDNIVSTIIIGISLILAAVAAFLWFRFGRDQKPLEPVTLYPPDRMTPAQIGTIIDGKTGQKEILSMIIWLADKGYLSIEETEKKRFTFIKRNPLPANAPDYAQTVYKALFPGNRKKSSTDNIHCFYDDMQTAQAQVRAFFDAPQNALFTDDSQKISRVIRILSFLPGILFSLHMGYLYGDGFNFLNLLLWVVFLGIVPGILFHIVMSALSDRKSLTKGQTFGKIVIPVVGLVILSMFIYYFRMIMNKTSILPILVIFLCTAIMAFFAAFGTKRTPQGNKWLGETLGFKHFIKTAELDRIKALVDEEPSYFYHILPYAYVLGVTSKWAKRFESLAIEPPHWYHPYGSYNTFNTIYFTRSLMNSMTVISDNIVVPPDSGSSGFGDSGFSGGGFSGGGGGGGGGGSW